MVLQDIHATHLIKRRIVLAALVILIVSLPYGFSAGRDTTESTADPGALQGTFLQLTSGHLEWKSEDWKHLFGFLTELGLRQIVVQWTVYDDVAFYTTAGPSATASPSLETVLGLADESGMKVLVGLVYDPGFWEKIERDPDLVSVYLRRLRQRSLTVARDLATLVARYPSFAGWYLSEEIDDVNWLKPGARRVLFHHLQTLAGELRRVTPPGGEIAISGFSNAHADPHLLERFWTELLRGTSIDLVFFQDGIGAAKMELDYLELYLKAIQNAVTATSRQLQVVVETFRQVGGAPYDDGPFRAEPASLERIQRQLQYATRYSTRGALAFSVPEYMTPLGGEEAERLFREWKELNR